MFFMPELVCGYIITRSVSRIPPFSRINIALCQVLRSQYPTLQECQWSRALPDPKCQSVESMMGRFGVDYENTTGLTKISLDLRSMLMKYPTI